MAFKRLFLLTFWIGFSCILESQELRLCYLADTSKADFGAVAIQGFGPGQLVELNRPQNRPVWQEYLQVFPSESWEQQLPPMLGKYDWRDSSLLFKPLFPFVQGRKYVAVLNFPGNEAGNAARHVFFDIPVLGLFPPTIVTQVFPVSGQLPANLLKMYLQFSAPMGLGDVYGHITLYDDNGQQVQAPFLEINPPLWDKHNRQLTLWFDPGRIKTGLAPNRELGPPLLPDKTYVLKIAAEWTDAHGRPLQTGFRKQFTITEPDYQKPDPTTWQISPPAAYTRQTLSIRFPEPLDRGTLESGIGITGTSGNVVSGDIIVSELETVWQFLPEQPWQPGAYKILLSRRLEDLAGNNLERLFDTPVGQGTTVENVVFFLPFSVE